MAVIVSCLVAAGCAGGDMPGVIWSCTSVDGLGGQWQAENFNRLAAFDQASDTCSVNSPEPTTCQVPTCTSRQ